MKDKLLAAIRLMYKNLGYSDKAVDAVATYLEATVTEDSQVDASVKAVEPILKAFQSEIDGRVSTAVAKLKTPPADPLKKEGDPDPADPKKQQEEVPVWAKTLIDQNKTLSDKVLAMEMGKSTDTRRQALEGKLKDVSQPVKDRLLKDFSRMTFKDDAAFEEYLTETETDVKTLEQNATNTALAQQSVPFKPGGTVVAKQVDADISAWAKSGTPETTAAK